MFIFLLPGAVLLGSFYYEEAQHFWAAHSNGIGSLLECVILCYNLRSAGMLRTNELLATDTFSSTTPVCF